MKHMTRLVATAIALALPLAAAAQDQKPAQWVPGTTMMPNEMLKAYPCHSIEEACYNIPAPEIQQVTFTPPLNGDAERGSKIANNIRWGNCFACHSLPGGVKGGTVGPDLSKTGASNLDPAYLYQRIWDGRLFSPDAHMPIYGTNKVLEDKDIRDVIAYLMTGN